MKFKTFIQVAGLAFLFLFNRDSQGGVTFTNFPGVHAFQANALMQDADGSFYISGIGAVYKVAPDGTETTNFFGANVYGPYLHASDGYFYGYAALYSANSEVDSILRMTNGGFETVFTFSGTNGPEPVGGLIQGDDGQLYGTTAFGGLYNKGTLFKISTNGTLTTLVQFNGTNGWIPTSLMTGSDGNFYGITSMGGTNYTGGNSNSFGTVFQFNKAGILTTLVSFNVTNGGTPVALTQGFDGNFYGLTSYGDITNGTNAHGTVFQMTTNGTLTTVLRLGGKAGNGLTSLILAADGNFYWVQTSTSGGGAVYQGKTDGTITPLVTFNGQNGADPQGLIQAMDGNFYGVTLYSSPTNNNSAMYRISVPMPAVFKRIAKTNNVTLLSWKAVATQNYQVQYSSDLTSTNWTNLAGLITATNGMMNAIDSSAPTNRRFYRVISAP